VKETRNTHRLSEVPLPQGESLVNESPVSQETVENGAFNSPELLEDHVHSEGVVLVGVSGDLLRIETERVERILCDIIFLENVEILADVAMYFFKPRPLDEEAHKKASILLKNVVRLTEEAMLILKIEETLNVNDVVYA
jgi:hypothetical protein